MKQKLTYFYSLLLTALFLLPWSGVKADEITIGTAGTTSNYVPITATYTDVVGTKVQTIYPASVLGELAGKVITAMSFPTEKESIDWGSPTFAVRLGEVDETAFASNAFLSPSFTTVYSGALSVASNSMDIAFSENFSYSGNKSLLVEIEVLTSSGFDYPAFQGNYVSNAAFGNKVSYGGNGRASFRPMVTITYEEAGGSSSCAAPTGLDYSDVTTTSVKLNWTAGGTEEAWKVAYKAKGDADWTIVAITSSDLTDGKYTLNSLSRATNYQVKVQAVCAPEDESGYSNVISFDTPCDITALPWRENFESETGKNPFCWDNSASTTPYLSDYPERVWGVYTSGGNKSIRMYNYNVKAGTALINTPNIVLPASPECELTFEYVHNASVTDFAVNISTNGGSSFSLLQALGTAGGGTADAPGTFQEVTIDLKDYAGQTIMLQFFSTADWNSGSIFVDNIDLHVKSSCFKPTLNDATDPTYEGVTFSWTVGGTEEQWQYIVVASGAAEDWSSPTVANTNSVTLKGYNAATNYDFYVRAYCGESSQSQSVKKPFTTAAIPAPATPSIASITTDGATASWTAASGITIYQYCVVDKNAAADWSAPIASVEATSVALTELEASHEYDFYVRSYFAANGGTSTAIKKSFKTACAAITSFPWEENFEDEDNNTVVDCWDNSGSTSPGATNYYLWGAYKEGGWSTGYNMVMRMCNTFLASGSALINTPSFTLPNDKNYEFTFKYCHRASCGAFVVKVSENGGDFTTISGASYSATSSTSYSTIDNFEEATIDLSAYKGKTIKLQFYAEADYGDGAIFVDDLSIHEKSSCTKPTLNDATAQTPEGATFTWTAGGTETQYDYCLVASGVTPENWVTLAENVREFIITGQAAGTYDFYVRSNCGGTDGVSEAVKKSFTTATVNSPANLSVANITNEAANVSWDAAAGVSGYEILCVREDGTKNWENAAQVAASPVAFDTLKASHEYMIYVRSYYASATAPATLYGATELSKAFTTKCDPMTVDAANGYTQNFNSLTAAGQIPECWDNSEGTTTNANYKWSYFATGHEGKCVRFDSYNNNSGRTNVLASPIFDLQVDADLEFWVKNPTGGAYTVQISVNGGDRQDVFTGLTSLTDWVKKEVVLTSYYDAENPKTIQFFFSGTSNNWNNQAYLYLDDFVITPQACRKPASDPVVNSKTGTTASISWGEGGASSYQFAVALKDEAPVWNAANVIAAASKTIEGLSPLTNYDFYVRTYCDEDNQSDARKVSFQTECADYVTLPFNADFNGLADVTTPDCWENNEGSITDEYKKWRSYNSNYIRFNSSTTDADETSILATPTIQLGEGNLLTFQAKNPTGGDFKVQIEGEGIAREDLLTGLTGIADWTLKYAAIPAKFDNKKVQLFFCATSNGGDQNAYISLDDVRVTRGEVVSDSLTNQTRFATLAEAGESMDVLFINRKLLYNGDYNTFCLPFSLSAEQIANSPLADFKIKSFDYASFGDTLFIAIAGASSIEAGIPYFISYQGNSVPSNQSLHLFKDVVITASTPDNVSDNGVTYQAVFDPVSLPANDDSYIFLAAGNKLYWPSPNNAKTVRGFRAYFRTSSSNNAAMRRGMPARLVERPNMPTSVENVQGNDVQSIKVIENNQVIIIRNGVKYTIQGQKIQ